MSRATTRGFTLLELMVTVAVLAILVAIAFPSFESTFRSSRLATSSNALLGALSMARSEAIRNTRGGGVCPSTNGQACDGDWSQGWMSFSDHNGNGTFDDGDTVVNFTQLNSHMVATGDGVAVIAFDSRGRRVAGADQVVVLRPEACGGQELQRELTIGATGAVRIKKEACP